jgi:hypothetical protein
MHWTSRESWFDSRKGQKFLSSPERSPPTLSKSSIRRVQVTRACDDHVPASSAEVHTLVASMEYKATTCLLHRHTLAELIIWKQTKVLCHRVRNSRSLTDLKSRNELFRIKSVTCNSPSCQQQTRTARRDPGVSCDVTALGEMRACVAATSHAPQTCCLRAGTRSFRCGWRWG